MTTVTLYPTNHRNWISTEFSLSQIFSVYQTHGAIQGINDRVSALILDLLCFSYNFNPAYFSVLKCPAALGFDAFSAMPPLTCSPLPFKQVKDIIGLTICL